MTKCLCGCGEEVKKGNKYINGHNRRGKNKDNDEGYKRVSEKLTGRTKENDEGYRKRAETLKKRYESDDIIIWNKGLTKETSEGVQQQSEKLTGRTKENHEGVRRGAEKRRGRTKETDEGVRRMAETLRKKEPTPAMIEGHKRAANKTRGRTKQNDEGRRRQAEKISGENHPLYGVHKFGEDSPHYGKPHSEESKMKIRESNKANWQDSEFVKRIIDSWNIKPNKPEKFIESLLNQLLPGEYKYNDGWFTIQRKIPDFVNTNGQKKIIEFNGDHWHTEKESKQRAALFKSLGYDTLFIWEHEMTDVFKVANKILKFHGLPIMKGTYIQVR